MCHGSPDRFRPWDSPLPDGPAEAERLAARLAARRREPVEAERLAARLAARRREPVEAENPYWPQNGGATFEDPDGWRVVLMPGPVI